MLGSCERFWLDTAGTLRVLENLLAATNGLGRLGFWDPRRKPPGLRLGANFAYLDIGMFFSGDREA